MTWEPCRLVQAGKPANAVEENDHSHWKAFRESLLTHSSAHYLNVIDQLHKERGYVRVTDVAKHLGITKAAASQGLGALKTRGYVDEDDARMLSLSREGLMLARMVEHNFMIISAFFDQVLGIERETARTDACKLEHLLAGETSLTLACFVKVVLDDPEMLKRLRDKTHELRGRFEGAKTCPFSAEHEDADCPFIGDPLLCHHDDD